MVRLDSAKLLRLDSLNMYVCLCVGATNQMVCDAVARGACTSKEVAAVCGAGGDCGRCRHTLRALIAASTKHASTKHGAQLDSTPSH